MVYGRTWGTSECVTATERMRDHETTEKVSVQYWGNGSGIVAYLLSGGPIGKQMVLLHCHGCYEGAKNGVRITTVYCPSKQWITMGHNGTQWDTMGVEVLNTLDRRGSSRRNRELTVGGTLNCC